MNHTSKHLLPLPGPECGSFANLLPLLGAGTLGTRDEQRLRLHLTTCAYCRMQQSTYDRMDHALRRAYGAPATLFLSPEAIMSLPNQEQRAQTDTSTAPVKPPRHRPTRRAISFFSALAAVLVIVVVVTAIIVSRAAQPNTGAAHQTLSSPTPTGTQTETPYIPNPRDYLISMQILPTGEGWAVGSAFVPATQTQPSTTEALILHYHNGQWKRMPAPSNAQLGLSNVEVKHLSMISTDEGWAIGSGELHDTGPAFILHYSKGSWTLYGSLMPNADLGQIQMLSPTNGWVSGGGGYFGAYGATDSVMLHYDGTSWTPAQVPPVSSIFTLDMLSPTNGWATGEDTILHYDGTQWTRFQEAAGIIGLSMGSASDGWAFGYVLYGAQGTTFWHYDGKQWEGPDLLSSVPNYDGVGAVSMDSATDGWAVGTEVDGNGQNPTSLYLHYTQGHWIKVPGPNVGSLGYVTMASANEGWALGNANIIVHYQHGAWTQYHF